MNVDFGVLLLALLLAAVGAWTGAKRQVVSLLVLLGAYFGAQPLGQLLGPRFEAAVEVQPATGVAFATAFSVVLLYALGRPLVYGVSRLMNLDFDVEGASSRVAGAVLGGAQAVLLGALAMSCLVGSAQGMTYLSRRYHVPVDSLAVTHAALALNLDSAHASSQAAFVGAPVSPGVRSGAGLRVQGAAGGLMDASDSDQGAAPSVTRPASYLNKARGVQQTVDQGARHSAGQQ